MVMLKIVLVLYSYYILIIQMSVTTQDSDTRIFYNKPKKTDLDFQTVLKENIRVARFKDKCPLRINGGINAGRSSVPYQVALRKELRAGREWVVFCGGAIVTKSYVLTALRCIDSVNMKKIIVIAGADVSDVSISGNLVQRLSKLKSLQLFESWRKVRTCHSHSEYDKRKMINDFAVLEVNKPFIFSNDVQAVRILSYEVQEQHSVTIPESTLCVVSGYGLIQKKKTEKLQMVCLPLVNLDICIKVYPNREHPKSTQICAGNDAKHSCPGDSGGPLVCKGLLVGIVSYGGEPGKVAGVYTFLRGYTDKKQGVDFYSCDSIQLHYSILEIMVLLVFTRIYYVFVLFAL